MEESDGRSFLREAAAHKLWSLWKRGQRPDVAQFISQSGRLSTSQLVDVLRVDQFQRWIAGEYVPVESYLMRYPVAIDRVLDLVYGECLVREELGETLSLTEYQERFPELTHSMLVLGAPALNSQRESSASHPAGGATTRTILPALPGFELHRVVGQGGMGVVYKARQLEPDRTVAIKIIRSEIGEQTTALRRFDREVRAAVRLNHANIARFFEANQFGRQQYYVMEYVNGIDLKGLVERTGFLPVEWAGEFVRQAAVGLQHAHERGLVHRDVKPANVMITTPAKPRSSPTESNVIDLTRTALVDRYFASSGTVVKVLEMGLARVISAGGGTESWSTLTVAGTFLGTPDYMAPEQWENPNATDIRADIYSLGCSLYFLLTGKLPFPGGTLLQKLDKHRSHHPIPAEQLRPDIPAKLLEVMRRMMAKRPADRHQTPGEVAADLQEATVVASQQATPVARSQPVVRAQPPGEVHQFVGHTHPVNGLAVSPDGKALVSAGQDGTVRIWEVGTALERHRLFGHTKPVKSVAFSPDNKLILSGGDDRTERVWQAKTGKPISVVENKDLIKSVAFSPDSQLAVSATADRVIRLWDVASGRRLTKFEGHTGDITGAFFFPDGEKIVSSAWDRTVRFWEAKTGQEVRCFGGGFSDLQWLIILAVAISPNGQRLAVGGSDGLLRVWDTLDGREIVRIPGHTDWITSLAFSPDGSRVITGSRDLTVRLWDLAAGREFHCFRGHQQHVSAVAFNPDGRHAFSAAVDGVIRYWRLPV